MVARSEALDGRFASLARIMGGRFSMRSRLGILELDAGLLSLRDRSGSSLFSVPAATVEAHRQRRLSMHPMYFQIRAAEEWWYLCGYGVTKYKRGATRELQERYGLCTLVPRPPRMSVDDYERITRNAARHQVLWAIFWVETLNSAGAS